jgi:hypothetical protein
VKSTLYFCTGPTGSATGLFSFMKMLFTLILIDPYWILKMGYHHLTDMNYHPVVESAYQELCKGCHVHQHHHV